jgi:polypeptide N-acetylgalactosaminyltransferase
MENRNELQKLSRPELDMIKREYLKDNVNDDFSMQLYNSMTSKGKNKYVSNLISIRRRLRDVRQPGCLKKLYLPENTSITEKLPKASVVIIFCNELLTLILRTVWSILNQTSRDLLHEIILVDDGSNDTDIIEVLPWYIQNRFQNENIRLIRNPTPKHIVGARMVGARSATGQVLVFLEGHCEVTPGWLEPLLYHVGRNPSAIAIPILDYIEYDTLELIERV